LGKKGNTKRYPRKRRKGQRKGEVVRGGLQLKVAAKEGTQENVCQDRRGLRGKEKTGKPRLGRGSSSIRKEAEAI